MHAPRCKDGTNTFLNGCLDIKGKLGPVVQLTKCYHQPNDNFTFAAGGSPGTWASHQQLPDFPQRCMEATEVPCTRAGCCDGCAAGRVRTPEGFCSKPGPPRAKKAVVFLAGPPEQ